MSYMEEVKKGAKMLEVVIDFLDLDQRDDEIIEDTTVFTIMIKLAIGSLFIIKGNLENVVEENAGRDQVTCT